MLYRTVIRESLKKFPDVEVVGSANNGRSALEKIEQLKPDLVTLDFEMPEMDGLGVLRWMREKHIPAKAVMISAFTTDGAAATMRALQEGALDFVVKPSGTNARENQTELVEALRTRIQTVQFLLERKSAASTSPNSSRSVQRTTSVTAMLDSGTASRRKQRLSNLPKTPVSAVGIGVSTGGPDALRVVLPNLPADLGVPVLLVQHMPPMFTKSLANTLAKVSPLRICEAEHGQIVKPNEVFIAPGGTQMKLVRHADQVKIVLTDDPPVQSCKPSVDYLFDSLKAVYGPRCLSVIMTGMGYDGAEGCKRLHELGGPVIAQDEASCVVFGMPRKPVLEGYADIVSPLDQIAGHIIRLVKGPPVLPPAPS